MAYLKPEDYDDISEIDEEAFASLATIANNRLRQTERDRDDDLTWEATMNYMNEVTALAEQFGIEGISYAENVDYRTEHSRFSRTVEYRLAQINVRRARRDRRGSVLLSGTSRERIQHFLERVKEEIVGANLPEGRKRALLDKVVDLEKELANKRLSIVAVATVAALVLAASHDFVDTLIEAPELVVDITKILGIAKVTEDEAAPLRVEHKQPLAAIPDFRTKPDQQASTKNDRARDYDDDLPF